MALSKPNRLAAAVCLGLALATLACYWPVNRHEFIGYDDHQYVLENPHVNTGLTWSGVVWAFTQSSSCNWHPLTWLSHMLDCQLYGPAAPGHLLTNLLFHILNSLLLFLLLKQLTGAGWRSAAVAALFAWHPLHVESVAWVSERKDVLSTFFFLLTLWAYARWAESKVHSLQPTLHNPQSAEHPTRDTRDATRPRRWYALTLLFFACGLMSKPMVVTLPCVLLLLDFWPLCRLKVPPQQPFSATIRTLWPFVREKLPFFALAAGSSAITFWAQQTGGAVMSMDGLPVHLRLANALLSYVRYLGKIFWPANLAVIYPYHPVPLSVALSAALLLFALSLWFLRRATRQPYLAVGWLWFLGTLMPVIGLVQVGGQAMADRYMYIPSIGLFVLLVWGLHALAETDIAERGSSLPATAGRFRWRMLGLLEAGALAACLVGTSAQLRYWQNSESLFLHAIEAAGGNFVAYDHLGTALLGMGKVNEAVRYLEMAARLEPQDAEAHYNLGTALFQQGRLDAAETQFAETVRLQPSFAAAQSNWGIALRQQGKVSDAALHFLEATRQNPQDPGHFFNLGVALLELDDPQDAASSFAQSVRLNPGDPATHYHLAIALARQHKPAEAMAQAQLARDLATASGQPETAAKAAELLKQW